MNTLKLTAACGCNMGKIRKNNEDNFYFNQMTLPQENLGMNHILYVNYDLEETPGLFGVFDGMGGEADGQIASYYSAGILKEKSNFLMSSPEKIKKNYEDIIQQMNQAVYQEAERRFNRMGCTAAILMFADKKVYLCNVGDSPIFRLRENAMQQISQDHTDAEMLKKQGITNRKPHLTQCIGISPEEMQIQPYLYSENICAGDRYLICSDGLTDMVSKAEIEKTLIEMEDVEACVECLVQKALDGGGRDNITILLIQVEDAQVSEKSPRNVKKTNVKTEVKEGTKASNLQISEEFKAALRQNNFLEEETKEIKKVQTKHTTVPVSVKRKKSKSKSRTGLILAIVLVLVVGILGKSLIHKNSDEKPAEEPASMEDLVIDDLSDNTFEGTLEDESADETEEDSEEPEEGMDNQAAEEMPAYEEVQRAVDFNADGVEDTFEFVITNEEGNGTLNLRKINEVETSLVIPCTYEISDDTLKLSAGQLKEECYSIVIQLVDANSGYDSVEYHVIDISMQDEKIEVLGETLTVLDKIWGMDPLEEGAFLKDTWFKESFFEELGFGALQSVSEEELFTYTENIKKNTIRVRQARTAEEEQVDNEVFIYWDGTDWQVYGTKAHMVCVELHSYAEWTAESSKKLSESFVGTEEGVLESSEAEEENILENSDDPKEDHPENSEEKPEEIEIQTITVEGEED